LYQRCDKDNYKGSQGLELAFFTSAKMLAGSM
jgi:hypothetical protein